MSQFAGSSSSERQTLIVEAIDAHRVRESQYCTFEAEQTEEKTLAWVQYRAVDGLLNLDCTPEEREQLTDVLETYPELSITEQTQPEDAEGINIRIQGYTDDQRLAEFIDIIFQRVYEQDEDYRLWVAEI